MFYVLDDAVHVVASSRSTQRKFTDSDFSFAVDDSPGSSPRSINIQCVIV